MELMIRGIESAEEQQIVAMIVRQDPWRRLGIGPDKARAYLARSGTSTFAAVLDDRLVGAVVFDLAGAMSSQGYISVLVVHPDLQRRGIGARLLDFAEGRIMEATREVYVCVSSFNQDAQRFYLRHGYELVGDLKDFVTPGFSELLYRKVLRNS